MIENLFGIEGWNISCNYLCPCILCDFWMGKKRGFKRSLD